MSTPDENEALSRAEFWDERYAKSDGSQPTHEWFRSFKALEPFLERHLYNDFPAANDPRIIHLGSGDSTIPYELLDKGYKRQLCVDFSPVVVQLMSSKDSGVKWQQVDVRDMVGVAGGSVDVAFDKGTLDAMIHGSPWSPPDDVLDNTGRYVKEVYRILRPGGRFLWITYRQPHFVRPLLQRGESWDLAMEELSDDGSFGYYGFILNKPE